MKDVGKEKASVGYLLVVCNTQYIIQTKKELVEVFSMRKDRG